MSVLKVRSDMIQQTNSLHIFNITAIANAAEIWGKINCESELDD